MRIEREMEWKKHHVFSERERESERERVIEIESGGEGGESQASTGISSS